jgi:hypothetical protein
LIYLKKRKFKIYAKKFLSHFNYNFSFPFYVFSSLFFACASISLSLVKTFINWEEGFFTPFSLKNCSALERASFLSSSELKGSDSKNLSVKDLRAREEPFENMAGN